MGSTPIDRKRGLDKRTPDFEPGNVGENPTVSNETEPVAFDIILVYDTKILYNELPIPALGIHGFVVSKYKRQQRTNRADNATRNEWRLFSGL